MPSSSDKDAFLAIFDQLISEHVTTFESLPKLSSKLIHQLQTYYSSCFNYTIPGGKLTRGLTVIKGIEVLMQRPLTCDEYRKAAILGWQVEYLQAFFLIMDDIMDNSKTRRGKPCWYVCSNARENAINDSLLIENLIYQNLRRHFSTHENYYAIVELFQNTTFQTAIGQHFDMNGDTKNDTNGATFNLNQITLDRYQTTAQYKTSYYSFYLPCALALLYCNFTPNSKVFKLSKEICIRLGTYFQIQDDVLDVFGSPEILGKVGTDIEDAKCSWLICQALDLVSSEQRDILINHYGKEDGESVKEVKDLYQELQLEKIYYQYEEEEKKRIENMIDKIELLKFQELFYFLLGKIYKRNK